MFIAGSFRYVLAGLKNPWGNDIPLRKNAVSVFA